MCQLFLLNIMDKAWKQAPKFYWMAAIGLAVIAESAARR